MWKCPESENHHLFFGTAHITQDWVIDKNNHFKEAVNTCTEVLHAPDKQDLVTCKICGKEAQWVE